MKTVVCFGDSNTYGTPAMAHADAWGRFAPAERWPGVMGAVLGEAWTVVEEGLPGRTTVHDDPIEGKDKNGASALPMILGTHRPIDVLIISLGANDLKARFSVTPEDVAASVAVLVRLAQASPAGQGGRPPKILVVAPPVILETGVLAGHFRGAADKSARFGRCYAEVAFRLGVDVLDAATLITSDPVDGIHLAVDQHAILGRAIAARLLAMRL